MKVESITFSKINDLGLVSKVVCPHIDYFIKDLLTTLVINDSIYAIAVHYKDDRFIVYTKRKSKNLHKLVLKYSSEFDSIVSAIKVTKTADNFAICDTLYKAESGKEIPFDSAEYSLDDIKSITENDLDALM